MPVVQNSSTGSSVTFIYRRGNVWFHMPMMHAMATAKTSTLEPTRRPTMLEPARALIALQDSRWSSVPAE